MTSNNNYCIRSDYQIRENNDFLDTSDRKDQFQNDVYRLAKKIARKNRLKKITDVGCGSAYKLKKYFKKYSTIGYDLEPTVKQLYLKYPKDIWIISDFNSEPEPVDLVICADVIEHVKNPDELIHFIIKMDPEHIVISTPDRDLLHEKLGRSQTGPPGNTHHIREWSFDEFENYISRNFNIIRHEKIRKEYGQVIYCKLKEK